MDMEWWRLCIREHSIISSTQWSRNTDTGCKHLEPTRWTNANFVLGSTKIDAIIIMALDDSSWQHNGHSALLARSRDA